MNREPSDKWLDEALDKFTIEAPSANLKERILNSVENGEKPGKQTATIIPLTSGKKFIWPAFGAAIAAAIALALVIVPGGEKISPPAPIEIAEVKPEQPVQIEQLASIDERANQKEILVIPLPEEEDAEVDEFILSLVEEEAFEEEIMNLL